MTKKEKAAAENYVSLSNPHTELNGTDWTEFITQLENTFLAGIKWHKDKMKKSLKKEYERGFSDGQINESNFEFSRSQSQSGSD